MLFFYCFNLFPPHVFWFLILAAGSDDVFLCDSEESVRIAFDKINGAINNLGVRNEGVLIQEFLQGTEYVVDSVSRDGVNKVTAIWQ